MVIKTICGLRRPTGDIERVGPSYLSIPLHSLETKPTSESLLTTDNYEDTKTIVSS